MLVSAVSWEIRPVLRHLRPGVSVLTLGVGETRAESRLREAISARRPGHVLLAGFSGGVREGQKAGDIALAESFSRFADKAERRHAAPPSLRAGLAAHLKEKNVALLPETRAVMVPKLAGPQVKYEAGASWPDACGVDMESYSLAGVCARESIPFLCVRAIFDEAKEPLFSLGGILRLPSRYRRASSHLAEAVLFLLNRDFV